MNKPLAALSGALLVAGMLLGPGYFIYMKYYSGAEIVRFPAFSQDASSIEFSVAGFRASSSSRSNAETLTPKEIELSPEMNPIAFILKYTAQRPPRSGSMTRSARFDASLSLGERDVWRIPYTVSVQNKSDDSGSSTVSMGSTNKVHGSGMLQTFDVLDSGTYVFDLEFGGGDLNITDVDIQVRRNVTAPSIPIALGGVAMLLIGFVGLYFSGKNVVKVNFNVGARS